MSQLIGFKITVVMPIYNGEKYLHETLSSLLSQSYTSFKVLCINDCSEDTSLEILEFFRNLDGRFEIVNTPVNLGSAPKCINFFKNLIKTEYFVYSSQDDTFSSDWLENIYYRARDTNSDAVLPDVVCENWDLKIKNRQFKGVNGDRGVILTGREAFELSVRWLIPGNALWRTELLTKHDFFAFNYNADEYTVRYYFLHCNQVAFSRGTFFYRQNNLEAITKKFSINFFSGPETELRLWKLAKQFDLSEITLKYLAKSAIRKVVFLYPYTLIPRFREGRESLQNTIKNFGDKDFFCFVSSKKSVDLIFERLLLNKTNLIPIVSVILFLLRCTRVLALAKSFIHLCRAIGFVRSN